MDRQTGIELIKFYEGLERLLPAGGLVSYLCPSQVWSIGYGSTRFRGSAVTRDTRCTIEDAERQFTIDYNEAEDSVRRLVKVQLTESQLASLASFIYNVGITQFIKSSLLRRLNAGENPVKVAREEMPRWDNNDLPGLVARRQNEVELFLGRTPRILQMTVTGSQLVEFDDAAEYDRGLAHQKAAWEYLQQNTSPEVRKRFSELFRQAPAAPASAVNPGSRQLKVIRESQHDNRSGQGYRECFSSSCGAIARFYGKVSGDDEYNAIRARYGDTTDAQAQIKALAHLGLQATLRTNGTPELLKAEILAGRPVAVGWIHKGPLAAPTGDGHWSVVTGFTEQGAIHADPNGEADISNGGYVNTTGGDGVLYSWVNWRKRWEVSGSPSRWRFAPGNGWALIVKP
jgi:GH24 family phage-related lysozyme (muramidase)